MKFFGSWEIPPISWKKEEHEEVPNIPEHVPSEKPESLKVDKLIEWARNGDVTAVADAFDEYVDKWQEYSTDRNLFMSEEMRALRKAKTNLISQSQAVAAGESTSQLEETLEYINEGLTDVVEKAADENYKKSLRIAIEGNYDEATPKERHEILEQLTHELADKSEENTEPEQPEPEEDELQRAATEYREETKLGNTPKGRLLVAIQAAKQVIDKESEDKLLVKQRKEKIFNSTAQEREEMKAAQEKYLNGYKDFYSKKGAKEKNEPDELFEGESLLNKARLMYGNALTEQARARLLEKYPPIPGSSELVLSRHREQVLNRYNRLVRYNEIIKPVAEAKYQARAEALGARGKGVFTRALSWVGKKNEALERKLGLSKNQARITRMVGTTAIAGTVGVFTGALASVGLIGLAGWGAFRATRIVGGALGGVISDRITGEVLAKKKKRAADKLAYVGRTENELNLEDLIVFDQDRMKLEEKTDEAIIQRKRLIARVFGGFVTGAGLSILENLPSVLSETHSIAETPEKFVAPKNISHSLSSPEQMPSAPLSSPEPEMMGHESEISQHTSAVATPELKVKIEKIPHIETEHVSEPSSPGKPARAIDILPKGMNPDSQEASDYLNRNYSPKLVEQPIAPTDQNVQSTPVETSVPPVESSVTEPDSPKTSLSEAVPSVEGVVTNKLGVVIDSKTPHVYELAEHKGFYVVYGGTPEQQTDYVSEYLQSPDHEGQGILMPVVNPNEPGKQVLVSVSLNQDKTMEIPQPAKTPQGEMAIFDGIDSFGDKIQ